jgi:hypothetical protein
MAGAAVQRAAAVVVVVLAGWVAYHLVVLLAARVRRRGWVRGSARVLAVRQVSRPGAGGTGFGARVFSVSAELATLDGATVQGTAQGAYPAGSWVGLVLAADYDPLAPQRFRLRPDRPVPDAPFG